MQKILITGTSGYVGSHLAKYLARRNYRVYGLDRNPSIPALQNYLDDGITGDISEEGRIRSFLIKNSIESVIHCAAKCLVGESVEKPELYEDYNFRRAGIFLKACLAAGVRSFNLSSTAAVYGEPLITPIPETHSRSPINPYGETKMRLEDHLLEAASKGKIKIGILRYFNVAGADLEAEIGEDHAVETHLIPNAIFAALGKKKSFQVFGEDYPTPDGTCIRDYIHVLDLAQAHELLFRKLESESNPLIYNLGTRFGYSVKEVLDEIDRHLPKKIKRDRSPRRPGDPSVLVADSSKARKELGWDPELSDLPTIVRSALRWHRRQLSA